MAISELITHIVTNPLDYIPPRNYVRLLFPLQLKEGVDFKTVFDDLQEALHKTFVQDPWIAGRTYRQSSDAPGWKPGQLEVRYKPYHVNGPRPYQLRYLELDTDWTYNDFKEAGFPSGVFSEDLLLEAPKTGDVDVNGADNFLCQANFLKGGLLLGMTVFHGAIDASGMLNIQKSWAENFRELHNRDAGGKIAPSRFVAADNDRSAADRIWKREAGKRQIKASLDDPWLRGLIGLDSGYPGEDVTGATQRAAIAAAATNGHPKTNGHSGRGEIVNRVMFLSSEDLSALHKLCLSEPLPAGGSPVSVSDAINALFWRAVLRARYKAAKARGIELDPVSVFESPVDIRETLGADFPSNYLGNCFLLNTARMPVAKLIDPATTLGSIAQALRAGASGLSSETVYDAYALLRATPDLSKVQGRFVERPESSDILLSNIIMFPMTEINFGDTYFENGGIPSTLRVLHGPYKSSVRLGHVLPKSAIHGGCELSVNLFEDEYEHLDEDEEFARYLVTIEA